MWERKSFLVKIYPDKGKVFACWKAFFIVEKYFLVENFLDCGKIFSCTKLF